MILSDTAKRQAAAVGLSESKALNLAAEANAQKTVRQYGGLLGGYLRSIARQYIASDVRVCRGFVFVLSGDVCNAIYLLPEKLRGAQ